MFGKSSASPEKNCGISGGLESVLLGYQHFLRVFANFLRHK